MKFKDWGSMRMVPWGYLEIHSATAFADQRFLQGSADELCWWVTHGDSSSSSTYMYSLVDVCFSFTVKHYTSGLCGFSPTPILITSAFDTNRFGKQQLLHVKDRIRDVSGLIYRNWNLLVSFFTFLKKEGRKEGRKDNFKVVQIQSSCIYCFMSFCILFKHFFKC